MFGDNVNALILNLAAYSVRDLPISPVQAEMVDVKDAVKLETEVEVDATVKFVR